ncbi:MAG: alpha/beta fold hydrolase [Promethearchaeota archaeon]
MREWKPASESKTGILIFHGITAYSELYGEMLAKPLIDAGYSAFGLDLRGHGLSEGIRGDYPSKERLIKDLCEVISFIKEQKEKLIILGHSLGVISAVIALYNCKDKIDGLILLSAGRRVREGVYKNPGLLKTLKILFTSLIFPSKPVITYYRDGITGLDDPLRNFTYTLRFMRILNAKEVKFPENVDIPVLVGIGDQDEIFEIDAARELHEEIPVKNKEFMVIKGAKHAEFPEGCWSQLIDWLNKNFK